MNFYHVEEVTKYFDNIGYDYTLVDYSEQKEFVFRLASDNSYTFEYDKRDLTNTSLVWRSEKIIFRDFGDTEEWADEYVSGSNWKESLRNIASVLNCPVVNSIESRQKCENKLYQLRLAQNMGLKIPSSLVSNSIKEINTHTHQYQSAIIKMIGDPHIPVIEEGVKQNVMTTCRIDKVYLNDHKDKIEPMPMYVQNEIEKKLEYRCIFVLDKVFALSINPFQHKIMEVDYRRGGMMVDYRPATIPKFVEEKLVKMANEMGLFSGCFDLIEDVNGDFIFLEVNPEGVWGLHDEIYDKEISKKFAESLITLVEHQKNVA